MKGYITTCDGVQYELPTLLRWEFSYTGSVPCDSFSLRCPYDPAMAETLRVTIAGRFSAAPGDTAVVSGTKLGISGRFRVIECTRRFGESGEASELCLQRE